MKILAVDDDVKVREVLSNMLSRFGYENRTATNGEEALNILKEDHFPIVISDVRMPGMDGMELLKEIKKKYSDTEVICITGHSNDYTFVDMIKLGASDFIAKPFSKDELEAKISRIIKEKKLESKIIESKKKQITIIDGIRDAIYLVDREFKILVANKAFAENAGLPLKDVIGKLCYQLVYKRDVPCEGDGHICPAKMCFDKGLPADAIYRHFKGTDKECYIELHAMPLKGSDEEITEAILIARDITEQKRTENEIRKANNFLDSIVDSSLDPIVVGDNTGNVVRANKSFLKMLDCREEELIGKHIMELSVTKEGTFESTTGEMVEINEGFFKNAQKKISRLIEERSVSNWESYYVRGDKKVVPVEMNIVLLYDKEGNMTGTVGISRDITERRKMEMKNTRLLEKTQKALEELEATQSYLLQNEKMASIGQLAAGVAHEINNPTGFVHSNLGSLEKYSMRLLELIGKYEEGINALKHNGHKDIAPFCEEIEELKKRLKIDFIMKDFQKVITDSLEGTERIKKIVADLKSFSHVDQAEFKQADINEGIESTLNVVWNELKYKCTVEKDYGDLPKTYCNLGQLNQVFANLLVNASHAIEEKGIIRIATRYVNGKSADKNDGKGHVEVTISDTGSGIPEDKVKRIFEPFFTTKEVGKGTGLGLSIAYDIIKKKHNGEIEVKSEVGKGTTFTITLPLMEGEQKVS